MGSGQALSWLPMAPVLSVRRWGALPFWGACGQQGHTRAQVPRDHLAPASGWGLHFSPAIWAQHQLLWRHRGLRSDFMPLMTQNVASPGATDVSYYTTLLDALLPAGIWPACDEKALNSEGSEAALLPLSWIRVTPCPGQKSCLLSPETQPGHSKTGETVQNGLQLFVVPVYGRVRSDASYKTWKSSRRYLFSF